MATYNYSHQGETGTRFQELVSMPGPKMCVHMLSGEVSYKICTRQYDCLQCPYDLMLDEVRWLEQNRAGHRTDH